MTPEGQKPSENIIKPLLIVGSIFLLAELSQGAFSKKVRASIWKRDKGKSVWSGETEGLTAAHQNHDKSNPRYNDPSNGRLLTSPKEQYIDHFNRHDTEDLGLSTEANNWVLRLLYSLMKDPDVPPPEEAGKKLIPIPRKK